MKMWLLAGLLTVAMAPVAAAMETTTDCQIDDSHRESRDQQRERADPPASPSPTVQTHSTIVATRDPVTRPDQQQRRRNGKRVPDAELIGPRGAL